MRYCPRGSIACEWGDGVKTLYHTIQERTPLPDDFLSNIAKGKPLPRDPQKHRLAHGISCWETLAQAREMARRFPSQGRFVAEIALGDDEQVQYERTTASVGHWTVWGAPDILLRHIQAVHPVAFG